MHKPIGMMAVQQHPCSKINVDIFLCNTNFHTNPLVLSVRLTYKMEIYTIKGAPYFSLLLETGLLTAK